MRISNRKEINLINLFREIDDADKDRVITYCKKFDKLDQAPEEARSVQNEIEEKYDPDHILDEFLFKPETENAGGALTEEELDLIAGYRKLDAYTKRKIRAQVYREVDDMEWINGIIIKDYQILRDRKKKKDAKKQAKKDRILEKESERELKKHSEDKL